MRQRAPGARLSVDEYDALPGEDLIAKAETKDGAMWAGLIIALLGDPEDTDEIDRADACKRGLSPGQDCRVQTRSVYERTGPGVGIVAYVAVIDPSSPECAGYAACSVRGMLGQEVPYPDVAEDATARDGWIYGGRGYDDFLSDPDQLRQEVAQYEAHREQLLSDDSERDDSVLLAIVDWHIARYKARLDRIHGE